MKHAKGSTVYFGEGGKARIRETARLAVKRATEMGLDSLLVFTSDGDGALEAARMAENSNIRIIAVTFPTGQLFVDESSSFFTTRLSESERKRELEDNGISVVQGTMPLQEIVCPGTHDERIEGITNTLSLLSPGLALCVQAILMATDAGVIKQGQEVVSMSADTAIIGTGAWTHWLFHPQYGLDIREIICKPRSHLLPSGAEAEGSVKRS